MKLKSIVALLGLTASIGAFADPFVQNSAAPSTINVVANGEPSLQSIADSAFGPGHINVNTGQSSAGFFASTTPNFATSVPTLIAEFTANAAAQSFGIWFGTAPATRSSTTSCSVAPCRTASSASASTTARSRSRAAPTAARSTTAEPSATR